MSKKIIQFERGIPGFLDEKEFILLLQDEESPFGYLQSVKNEDLSFIVVSPFLFFKDYEFNLGEEVLSRLGVTTDEEIVILSIVTVQNQLVDATANLLGPIVININNLKGEQIILEGNVYTTRHRLFPQSVKIGGE